MKAPIVRTIRENGRTRSEFRCLDCGFIFTVYHWSAAGTGHGRCKCCKTKYRWPNMDRIEESS